MAGTSSIWPLHTALAAAITADATLFAMLAADGVYSLQASRKVLLDYIVLGSSTARQFPTFGRVGETGIIALHIWTAADDQRKLLIIYGELRRVLQDVLLTLTGVSQLHVLGQVELLLTTQDPTGEFAHAVCQYSFTTL